MIKQTEQKDSNLWVDRYAPKQLEDLVGNSIKVKECMAWLAEWAENR